MPLKTWITHESLLEESAQSCNLSAKGEELSVVLVMQLRISQISSMLTILPYR